MDLGVACGDVGYSNQTEAYSLYPAWKFILSLAVQEGLSEPGERLGWGGTGWYQSAICLAVGVIEQGKRVGLSRRDRRYRASFRHGTGNPSEWRKLGACIAPCDSIHSSIVPFILCFPKLSQIAACQPLFPSLPLALSSNNRYFSSTYKGDIAL